MTVLVGKNNEGKSNILRALTLAMNIMKIYADSPRLLSVNSRTLRSYYSWERDYPLSLQEKKPNGSSSVNFIFELSEQELQDIRTLTNVHLNSHLSIQVSVNSTGAKIDIPKRGTTGFSNNENKLKVIDYICNKVDVNFIPAVRTESDSLKVIRDLIEKELLTLDELPEYTNATATINRLQQAVLDRIAGQIVEPLKNFLPSVRDIKIRIAKDHRRTALRRDIEVVVDDSVPTPLELKGDGIKSLTALAMLNIPRQTNQASIIAIEEPESHLHPESARQLYQTIVSLSKNHQVILTTHSPLFINRTSLEENIIVNQGKAIPAKRIKEIREVLGTQVSDNLVNAENILLVEGQNDKTVLDKLLPVLSDKIKKALQAGTLVIDFVGGTGNLHYKLAFYRNIQCRYHVLLDNDEAGRQASQRADIQDLLSIRNITLTSCAGARDSELEDCYAKTVYEQAIWDEFGVRLSVSEFRRNSKWSNRIGQCFTTQGKPWDENVEKQVKAVVAKAVAADPAHALNPHRRSFIDSLVLALEEMLA